MSVIIAVLSIISACGANPALSQCTHTHHLFDKHKSYLFSVEQKRSSAGQNTASSAPFAKMCYTCVLSLLLVLAVKTAKEV